MFGSNKESKNASVQNSLNSDFEASGPFTSAQSGYPQSKGISSVFRRQRLNKRATSSARPWTATQARSTLADVDSATPHNNQDAGRRVTKKAPNAYTKRDEEDSKSLQSSSQNESDPPVQKPANITFSTDDPQAYSDIEDIGFEDDQVPEVREDVFARPLSAKNRSRQFIHRPSSIKTQRFQRFQHRTKNRRNVSLPETVVLKAGKSGEDLSSEPKQIIEVPKDEETKHLDEAYIPQIDVDLAPQLDEDKKVVQVKQEELGLELDEPILPVLAVVEREPSPVQALNETVIVVSSPPAVNHNSNSAALSANATNENATTAIVENGTMGSPSSSALPQPTERSIYERITRRIAKLRNNRVGDSAGLVEQADQIKPESAVDDDQNKGRLHYLGKKMAIFLNI